MAKRAIKSVADPFTPITSEAEWDEKGWARESEPIAVSPHLGAVISIRLNAETVFLVRQAARRLGMSKSEFVRRAAIQAATEAIGQGE